MSLQCDLAVVNGQNHKNVKSGCQCATNITYTSLRIINRTPNQTRQNEVIYTFDTNDMEVEPKRLNAKSRLIEFTTIILDDIT